VLVVFSVVTVDKMKIDDPVGAISVHLVCGIWGTLAVGIFKMPGTEDGGLVPQLIGVVAAGVFCVVSAGILFIILDKTLGMRVSEEEEIQGLDIGEHGMEAYGGFQIFNVQ
jgi:Amt family ammonium transporter